MTYLRVLVGALFLLAVIGAVVSTPFGPSPVLAAAEKADLLDINTDTGDELKALPCIGDAHSEKIIKGRPCQRKGLPGHASDLIRATRRVVDSTRRG